MSSRRLAVPPGPWPSLRGAALIGLAVCAGCAEELADPEQFGVCTDATVTRIFTDVCARCHGTEVREAGLDLVSPGLKGRLLGVRSVTPECAGRPRVDDAGGSYHLLLDKLRPLPGCGARMPKDGPYLSLDETDCLERWVLDVAAGGAS